MELYNIFVDLIFELSITLGVGSSTFALTFYILALTDGNVDASERRFMHTVYFVLRIGMALIALGLIASLFGAPLADGLTYTLQWALLAVITINAILMTVHVMPMKYGPVIAGGSWYSLFFVTTLPVATWGTPTIIASYAGVLVFLYVLLNVLKALLHPKKS